MGRRAAIRRVEGQNWASLQRRVEEVWTLKDVKSSGVALARHAQKKPLVPFIDFGARTTPMWYKATVVDKYHRLCVIRKPLRRTEGIGRERSEAC